MVRLNLACGTVTAYSTVVRGRKMKIKLPRIILPRMAGSDEWVLLQNPLRIIIAWTPEEVFPCMGEVEKAINEGLFAAGFIGYEAASGFDSSLETSDAGTLPLLWFGIFNDAEPYELDLNNKSTYAKYDWLPDISREKYDSSIGSIHSYLQSGDTYQVNYTFRMNSDFTGDAWTLFVEMQRAQRGSYAAYIETEDFAICSASPGFSLYKENACPLGR